MNITVDGKTVFAATGGRPFDPKLPTIIFVHGAGMDHTVWQLQTRYFAYHGHNVLAVDLPGHGRSQGPVLESLEDVADWIGRLMEAAGVGKAALAGHSMGAFVVLEAAARLDGRVSALALLGVAETMPVHPDLQAAADVDDHLAYDLLVTWGFGMAAQMGGHPTPGSWMTGGGVRLLEQTAPGRLGTDFRASSGYGGALAAAAKVGCPTLLILGREDRMTPINGAKLVAEAIPSSKTVVLERCGHMMTIEQPDATLDALRDFLSEHSA